MMVKSSAMRTFVVTLLGLSALLMACGPSANSAEVPPQDPAAIPFVGEPVVTGSTDERPTTAVDMAGESAATVDERGIPVGFTDEGRPYRGHLDAPVLMEEFSDFQCPYCSRFAGDTMPSLLENQIADGQVVLVFHDFPLTSIHPQAAAAANACLLYTSPSPRD